MKVVVEKATPGGPGVKIGGTVYNVGDEIPQKYVEDSKHKLGNLFDSGYLGRVYQHGPSGNGSSDEELRSKANDLLDRNAEEAISIIGGLEDPKLLNLCWEAERRRKDRKTVVEAIRSRLDELYSE